MPSNIACAVALALGYAVHRYTEAQASGVPLDVAFTSPLEPIFVLRGRLVAQQSALAARSTTSPSRSKTSAKDRAEAAKARRPGQVVHMSPYKRMATLADHAGDSDEDDDLAEIVDASSDEDEDIAPSDEAIVDEEGDVISPRATRARTTMRRTRAPGIRTRS
jgi:hypothetical protein